MFYNNIQITNIKMEMIFMKEIDKNNKSFEDIKLFLGIQTQSIELKSM